MDFFESHHFSIGRTLMVWIGQWPYDTSYAKQIRRLLITLLFVSALISEISRLLTADFDVDVYVDTISSSLICMLCFTKYCTWWINGELFIQLLEYIKSDWSTIQREQEMSVIRQYTEHARVIGIYYLSCILGAMSVFASLAFVPRVLDIILPLNESRPLRHPLEAEYFVDSQKYFYPILLHMVMAALIVHTIACATDWYFMYIIMHACGSFVILGIRLEHLFDDNSDLAEGCYSGKSRAARTGCRFCARIGSCVEFHRKIMKYLSTINEAYVIAYLVQLLLAVLILTALLLRLYDKLNPFRNASEVLMSVLHACGLVFIIFLNVYPAQMLMDASANNFFQAYCSRWYTAPLPAQKLLILLLRKCMEPCRLTAANVVTASVEIFATIVQTSLSYFTVLYSMK